MNYKLIICLGINFAITCLAIFVFGTRVYLNDDISISWMTYGINNPPSARTFYTHWILGWIYGHLFSLVSGFNWQTLIQYLGLTFSGTVGLYVVLNKNNRLLVYLWLLFEIVFFYDVYVCLTFSVVAAFIACQGYIALLISEYESSRLQYIMIGLLMIFSSMLRLDSFLAISGYAFFVWIVHVAFTYIRKEDISCIFRRYLYPFVIIIGLCFLFVVIDHMAYTKGEWKKYREYETTRLIFTDYRNTLNSMSSEELKTYGFTPSMSSALLEWRNNDPEKLMDVEKLKLLEEAAVGCNSFNSTVVWKDYLSILKQVFSIYYESYFALLLLALEIYAICTINRHHENIFSLLLLLPFFGEIFYLAYIGRLDGGELLERCAYIVLMGFCMGLIIFSGNFIKLEEMNRRVSKVFSVISMISICIILSTKNFSANGLGLVDVDELQKEYNYLGNSEKIYISEVWVLSEIEEKYGAWQVPRSGSMDRCISIGGWMINHPMMNEYQTSLECVNPYRALFENENVYYIREKNSEEEVLNYLRENYDERIVMEYVKEKGEFKVFKYYVE